MTLSWAVTQSISDPYSLTRLQRMSSIATRSNIKAPAGITPSPTYLAWPQARSWDPSTSRSSVNTLRPEKKGSTWPLLRRISHIQWTKPIYNYLALLGCQTPIYSAIFPSWLDMALNMEDGPNLVLSGWWRLLINTNNLRAPRSVASSRNHTASILTPNTALGLVPWL